MKGEAKGRAGKTTSRVAAIVAGLKSRFLEGLDPAEVHSIVAAATLKQFKTNFLITREGRLCRTFFSHAGLGRASFHDVAQGREGGCALAPAWGGVGRSEFFVKASAVCFEHGGDEE